jgi:hypothetical protein
VGFLGDTYYYSLGQIKSLLKRYWMFDPMDFDEAEGRADIKMALEYYGLKEKDCIKVSRKKFGDVVCYRTKVKPKVVGLIAEYLNGNIWFLKKKPSRWTDFVQLDLEMERELVGV